MFVAGGRNEKRRLLKLIKQQLFALSATRSIGFCIKLPVPVVTVSAPLSGSRSAIAASASSARCQLRKLGNMPGAPSRRWPSAGRGRAAGEPLSTTHLWRLASKSPAARAGLAASARASRSAFFLDCHERF